MNIISVQPITDRPIIDAIAPDDFMLIGDASDNNVVKRVLVSALKNYFVASSPTPTPTPTPFTLRIDCGSTTSYTDSFGKIWSADAYRTSGAIYRSLTPINFTDNELYLTEAYNFVYQIPLTNGDYIVKLLFAELDNEAQSRLFTVLFNNQIVLPNYSIFNTVGLNAPDVQTIPVTITSGALLITTTNQNAARSTKICAIEILG